MTDRSPFRTIRMIALEDQRAVLGDAIVDSSIAVLREKLEALSQSVITRTDQEGERALSL
ncbi:MAG: hypothetical protein U0V48_00200 [Anaerolineales bacterium]